VLVSISQAADPAARHQALQDPVRFFLLRFHTLGLKHLVGQLIEKVKSDANHLLTTFEHIRGTLDSRSKIQIRGDEHDQKDLG
jgi:hypothetical protein